MASRWCRAKLGCSGEAGELQLLVRVGRAKLASLWLHTGKRCCYSAIVPLFPRNIWNHPANMLTTAAFSVTLMGLLPSGGRFSRQVSDLPATTVA